MKDKENPNIELRSDEVKAILGQPPRWIIRWGVSVIFGIILLLLTGSMFFSYPDIVRSEVQLTYEHPATWITANSTGKLKELYVTNEQTVSENELLAVIGNEASPEDVNTLQIFIDSLPLFFKDYDIQHLALPDPDLKLGDMQDSYIRLYLDSKDYIEFIRSSHYRKKVHALNENLNIYIHQRNKLEKQIATAKSSENKISADLTELDIKISELKLSLIDQELDHENQLKNKRDVLRSDYEKLLSQLSIWESRYLLKATASGKIIFTLLPEKNRQVKSGEILFAIVSDDPGKIIGKTSISAADAVKVKKGQRANIKLDGYPAMEYGILTGEVLTVSLIPVERVHLVELKIPENMHTSYGKKIDFNGDISGSVEIITEDITLFDRIIKPVRNTITNKNN